MGLYPKGSYKWDKLINCEIVETYLEEVGCTTLAANGAEIKDFFSK